MPWFDYLRRPLVSRSGFAQVPPMTTGPSTGTDLLIGRQHILITSSDGGYYSLDPPTRPGLMVEFFRGGTTATTSYIVPDTTDALIYTSSGSSGGRLVTLNGMGAIRFEALTTAQWIVPMKHGNIALTTST